jgi:hypothetical protein
MLRLDRREPIWHLPKWTLKAPDSTPDHCHIAMKATTS